MADKVKHISIKDWSKDDRPREKLAQYGAENLSNSELLAILIGSGSKGFSALDAAKELIKTAGSVHKLPSLTINKIKQIKGLGDARAISLLAAIELTKRIKAEPNLEKPISSAEMLARKYIPKFYGIKQEKFLAILLDTKKRIIKDLYISIGTLDTSIVHPRDVFREAIENNSSAIILMHNHPSGSVLPSRSDINSTKNLIDASHIIGIPIIDHIIIGGDDFFSMREAHLLQFGD